MYRFSHGLVAILVLGILTSSCGLIDVAEDALTPRILYVSTTGNDANNCLSEGTACLTLSAALDKSNANTTIHIGAGHFYFWGHLDGPEEPVYDLKNGIIVEGAGQDLTIFHSARGAYTFRVSGPRPVTIRNLGIDASGAAAGGIDAAGGANNLLENIHVFNARAGIRVKRNGVIVVRNSVIDENAAGVSILWGGSVAMVQTVVAGNNVGIDNRGEAKVWESSVFKKNVIGISNNGRLEVSHSMFRNNTHLALNNGMDGHAIVVSSTFGSNGYLDVRPEVVPDITSHADSTISNSGEMHIVDSTISNNYGHAVVNNVMPVRRSDRVGDVYTHPDLSLERVQVIDNYGGIGCAVKNQQGVLRIQQSNIQDNECVGVHVYGGDVGIFQSSIIHNETGLFVRGESSVDALNTTISENYGFGIDLVAPGRLTLRGVTVAYNLGNGMSSADGAFLDIEYTVVTGLCNASITDRYSFVCNTSLPQSALGFGPLTEEEGTWFLPLLAGSPLIDVGYCPWETDQRGTARQRDACDVGAYEFQVSTTIAPLEFVTPAGGVPGVVPLYTDTPQAPAPMILTFTKSAYCRKGPGALYRDISGFQKGDTTQVDGRNATDPRWWWVLAPDGSDHCWVTGSAVEFDGPADELPVQPALPLPNPPSGFSDSTTCPQKSKNRTVTLNWKDSPDETGYRIFRDGVLLAELAANVTSFTDSVSFNKDFTYVIQAINANGVSISLDATSLRCK